ncbi:MFS transporter [Rhodanobacter sp. DHG33]|uniref:MFS transporter n=1 Tax=Rhodanobacter sp. DHG33 TaxID=2775921 RepID=UPI00177EC782|nr:MFS transporter [Rhodanobacter sp. DHG33]MBD8898618.1 MFS transporter [Rhodanobacter sp. DHG33]
MSSATPKISPLAHRDFRLLFGGSSISALGDQFTLVALPWLVLKLTGSPAALGLVLATMALPRAAFMLIGGAVVDRLSPRRVLLWARAINALLIGTLTLLVFSGAIRMPIVYALALGIGLSTAFAYPAASALLPRLLAPQELQPANALMMGARQLSVFVGPALAGLVIGTGAAPSAATHGVVDAGGLGMAFAIDSASFICSLVALILIRTHDEAHARAHEGHVLANVLGGLRAIWADLPLRAFMLYVAVVSVFVGGPLQVGLPVLADTQLDHGAASLGILMTANGGGMLVGGFLSGWAGRLARGQLGLMILCIDSLAGLALAALAFDHSTVVGATLLACTGVFAGIAQIAVVSWIQRRVPPAMMGRTMSVLMFAFMGLGPLSAAIAGSLLKVISLPALFAAAGLMLTAIALTCMGSPALRSIGTPLRVPDAA